MSTTWTTISPGYWNNPQIWSTGITPPYISADTFIIQHPVAFQDNIVLNAGAFIRIDSTGGLCAHHNITVNTGASILKYGVLEVDTLYIPGGDVNCLSPGEVILWLNAHISNGGAFQSNCAFSIGPWFECVRPQFGFMNVLDLVDKNQISIFPNPATDHITIEFKTDVNKNTTVTISNIQGQQLLKQSISNINTTLDVSGLSSGIYFLRISSDEGFAVKKFVKE